MPPELLAQFPIAERAIEALGLVALADGRVRGRRRDRRGGRPLRRPARGRPDPGLHAGQGPRPVRRGDRVSCSGTGAAGSSTTTTACVRSGASSRPRSPTGWPSSAMPPTAIPACRAGAPSSAAAVLARYGSLEEIPADPAAWDVAVRGAPAALGGDPARAPGRRSSCTGPSPVSEAMRRFPSEVAGRAVLGAERPGRPGTTSATSWASTASALAAAPLDRALTRPARIKADQPGQHGSGVAAGDRQGRTVLPRVTHLVRRTRRSGHRGTGGCRRRSTQARFLRTDGS